eukprot:GFUD01006126.1.p1 GENE.GFUD01006126.1~~GFUD01006126.1.p1  ORF type:complete len:529 (+),score=114.73 GFUD01006126.1:188-1774(+)
MMATPHYPKATLFLTTFSLTLTLQSPSTPLASDSPDYAMATEYLAKYGYIKQSQSGHSSAIQRLDTAIIRLQEFAGLKPTGEIDKETVEVMTRRRCGVKDVLEDDPVNTGILSRLVKSGRSKRYALHGSRWKPRMLTYRITKYPSKRGMSRNDVDLTIKKAFDVWAKEANIKFVKKTSGKVNIDIKFEKRSHGDDDAFDGIGGTLAHAFFPIYGGDVHFDDDEDWTMNSFRGTSLLMSASHELGHSLGLAHSNVRGSLMAPFYRGYERDLSLHSDDVDGIQALYGRRDTIENKGSDTDINVRSFFVPIKTTPPTRVPAIPTVRPKPVDNNVLCKGNLDTMVTTFAGVTFAFLGSQYWKLTDTAVEPGYPRLISQGWTGLPWSVDASFTWTNGKTYFFKGSQYWRFADVGQMDEGYPKEISEGFDGIPNNVDAAMVWALNSKIYFFKGSQYWKFDPEKSPPVSNSYPRPISNWDGIPDNLDSAMQYSNGKTYFFKSGQYYRLDDDTFTVDTSADQPYPRDTSFWWFGCK